MTTVTDLKTTHRATWAAGDYAAIAELIDDAPPRDLFALAPVRPGETVLDVATGTGNLAIRAAATGAQTAGLDLTPELFDAARERAASAGVIVDWVEGDAEALPYARGEFDLVLSAFGVQFAPRHEVVAREVARVLRPGGRLALVNWTPGGLIGEVLGTIGGYLPAPPAFASPPGLWGNEAHVRRLFAGTDVELAFARGHNPFRFASPEAFIAFFEARYGPMLKAREKLTASGDWSACRAELLALATRRNSATDGTLLLQAEYLVIVGEKAKPAA